MEKLEKRHHPLYRDLTSIVGHIHITDEEFACWATVGDYSSEKPPTSKVVGPPSIIVRPQNTEQVSRILKSANKTKTPVTVAGAKSGIGGGCTPRQGGILLDMLDMNKVLKIDESSMAVLVQGGCTWSKMRYELEKRGYTTGFLGPHGMVSATVGGSIANNVAGIGAFRYGMLGENIVSLEVALPNGDVIKTGSRSNASSDWLYRYCNGPDMVGLFIGSGGALGVITEAALKIYPLPKCVEFESYWFDSIEAGVKATHELQKHARRYIWEAFLVMGKMAIKVFAPKAPPEATSVLSITLEEDDERIIKVQKEICDKIALKEGGKLLGPETAKGMCYDQQGRLFQSGLAFGGGFAEPLGVEPTLQVTGEVDEELKLVEKYKDIVVKFPGTDIPAAMSCFALLLNQGIVDFAECIVYNDSDPDIREEFYKFEKKWYERSQRVHGRCIPGVIGKATPAFIKSLLPQYLVFLKTIKEALDPNDILNPGVLF